MNNNDKHNKQNQKSEKYKFCMGSIDFVKH